MIFPYAGLALGATYAEMKLYYNTYVIQRLQLGFPDQTRTWSNH